MDSVFTSLHRNFALLDLVDEAWAADFLSDDDIEVPNLGNHDEDDDLNEQEQDDEKWNEMGLAEFQPSS